MCLAGLSYWPRLAPCRPGHSDKQSLPLRGVFSGDWHKADSLVQPLKFLRKVAGRSVVLLLNQFPSIRCLNRVKLDPACRQQRNQVSEGQPADQAKCAVPLQRGLERPSPMCSQLESAQASDCYHGTVLGGDHLQLKGCAHADTQYPKQAHRTQTQI